MDQIQLQFEPQSLWLLNVILGVVMFGVALDLRVEDFRRIFTEPRGVLTGLVAQLVLLPALTLGLCLLFSPPPSVALGMILVAACPGGNMSNFLTWVGRGDASLSVTITSTSTLLSTLATPLNLAFWGSLNPSTAPLLKAVRLDIPQLLLVVSLLLALPLLLGMGLAAWRPALARRAQKPFKVGSLLAFAAFILIALGKNQSAFFQVIDQVFWLVLVHNGLAFALGYGAATAARVSPAQRRAITMEVGIQNSGLGLVLIFTFFEGLGGMAVLAAWWGVWHLVAGLALVSVWSRRHLPASS